MSVSPKLTSSERNGGERSKTESRRKTRRGQWRGEEERRERTRKNAFQLEEGCRQEFVKGAERQVSVGVGRARRGHPRDRNRSNARLVRKRGERAGRRTARQVAKFEHDERLVGLINPLERRSSRGGMRLRGSESDDEGDARELERA